MLSTSSDKLAVKAIRHEVFDLCSSKRNVNGLNLTHLDVVKINDAYKYHRNLVDKKRPEDGKEPCKLDKIFQTFTEEIEYYSRSKTRLFSSFFFPNTSA